jgi:hypothetical protein
MTSNSFLQRTVTRLLVTMWTLCFGDLTTTKMEGYLTVTFVRFMMTQPSPLSFLSLLGKTQYSRTAPLQIVPQVEKVNKVRHRKPAKRNPLYHLLNRLIQHWSSINQRYPRSEVLQMKNLNRLPRKVPKEARAAKTNNLVAKRCLIQSNQKILQRIQAKWQFLALNLLHHQRNLNHHRQ